MSNLQIRPMKDSGVDWIGLVPATWRVFPLKSSIRWKSEKNHAEARVLSLYRDYGVIPKDSRDDNHNVTSLDTSDYKFVEIGDLVVNKMKAWQGSIAVSGFEGIVSPAYHVCRITNSHLSKKYLHYLLRNVSYLPEYMRLSTGLRVGQWDLGFDDFKNIPIVLPDYDEQCRIVDFLDRRCAEIDRVIAETEKTIAEYKALKQSVITEAVTRGIRPNRPMKNSGVEWIGKIPNDWTTSRVGLHYEIILGKMLCSEPPSEDYTLEPYFCAANVHFDGISDSDDLKKMWFSTTEKQFYSVKEGDLLVVEGGAGAGGSAIVHDLKETIYIQNSIMIVRSRANSDNRYLRYLIEYLVKQGYIEVACNKATIPHFTKDKLATVPFPVIPADEQNEISDYLDIKCDKINSLIEAKQQLLTELEAYKKSVIYEYVTGKKEVPNV